jgi:hypothetical protein
MGWQLAGGVNLMIPPGTAVRDAHACYEVVVLVKHERNSTMWDCWRLQYMAIGRLFQHPWRGNFSPQSTCTKTSTQSVYFFFDVGETVDEYDGRKSH